MNLEGISALLVEDNPEDARRLLERAREAGAGQLKLEHVRDTTLAADVLARKRFDVILLDLSLPNEPGLTALAHLHALAPKTPVVALANSEEEAMAVKALRSGAHDYLLKSRTGGDLLLRSVRYAVERGRSVEALERREEHYRSLIEHSLDLISILNPDGTIRYASPSHQRVLGYELEELVGQNVLSFVHPGDVAPVQETFHKTGAASSIEYRFRHKDGTWRVLETFGRNLSGVQGVGGLVVNSRDVTERKRLEEQLHHSQRLEAVGRLAGGVAHDFNNLLMVISGYSQMLLEGTHSGDPAREDLEQIVKAADRATDLTRQLLAFSRRQVVHRQLLDLNVLVQDMDRMLRRVMGEDIELVTVLAPVLQKVRADPGQIEQVILNMAVNARDAMPQGGKLTLETTSIQLDRDNPGCTAGRYVLLALTDTGCGMDPQVQSRVFEPFFTTKQQGTGLGLSTSYGIIKQNGGHIWVDSKPGQGTSFRICLPLVDEVAEKLDLMLDSPLLHGTETVLLVEDEDGVRRVVETMLKRSGYHVLCAASATQAIGLAEGFKGKIDLLITDLVMPGMSGRELAATLLTRRPDMRVLYVSGYGDLAGVEIETSFLQKPFTNEDLALKIRERLLSAP